MAVVSPAEPRNIEDFAVLLAEMTRFYGATTLEPLDQRLDEIRAAIFSDPPLAYTLLAWEGHEPVGFATYSFLWPAVGLTRSLYVKELFVTESRRRSGVGTLLMAALMDVADDHSCSRVEWTADEDNIESQHFYDRLARRYPSKIFYRVEPDGVYRGRDT